MRVLLISSNSSSAGGGEQYLVYLAEGLKGLGDEPVVLLSDRSYMDVWDGKFKAIGVEVVRRDLIGLRERPLRSIQSTRDKKQVDAIAAICSEIGPQAIHVNQQYCGDGLDYVMGAIRYGKAVVFGTIHMPMITIRHPRNPWSPKTWLLRGLGLERLKNNYLKKWYAKHRYHKLFISETSKAEYERWMGLPDRNSSVVICGISTGRFRLGSMTAPGNVIAFCGRLVPQKDPMLLVDGWLYAVNRLSLTNSKLVLIGDGPLKEALRQKLNAEAPAGSWQITGWVENPEEHMRGAAVMVFTSQFEGLPLAVIEASCMGKACVTTPFVGAAELRRHIPNLRVTESRDKAVIAQAIMESIGQSPITEREVGAVRDYFDCARMARDTRALYTSGA